MKITAATYLTLVRILLVPCIIYALMHSYWVGAFILVVIAALTDLVDGKIARLYNQESRLGACLDPLADKFLLLGVYGTLWYMFLEVVPIPAWFILCVVVREGSIMLGSLYVLACSRTDTAALLRPTWLGKCTMALQCIMMGMAILYVVVSYPVIVLQSVMGITFMSMLISFAAYVRRWYMHKGASCLMLICLANSLCVIQSDDHTFTVEPTSKLSQKQKYADLLLDLFARYAELLVDELCIVSEQRSEPISQAWLTSRYTQLQATLSFIETGVEYKPEEMQIQKDIDIFLIMHKLAQVERAALDTLRCLLERNIRSCFVNARAKITLERYVDTMRILIDETSAAKVRILQKSEVMEKTTLSHKK